APAYQASAPQTQGVLKEDFSAYVKANDAVMRNMQTQVNPTNNGNTEDVQPQTVHPKPVTSPLSEPTITPVSASRPNPQASISLSLSDLTPTCMTLELADRSITSPVGIAEDVYVKVGSFHFPTDFVVVDFDADPRVPLILRRSFLKTGKAIIDVFEGELTLCVGKEAITFHLD
nr:reverse transcriptase domain-containing protein [Tanacetum cinerariifolium]GFB06530.1 reverse transcriptase domain-containing protein [Tanacetum cinerariifolium]